MKMANAGNGYGMHSTFMEEHSMFTEEYSIFAEDHFKTTQPKLHFIKQG